MLYEVGYPNRPYGQYNTSRPKDAVKMYCDQYGIKAKDIRRIGKGTPYGVIKKTATYEVRLGE